MTQHLPMGGGSQGVGNFVMIHRPVQIVRPVPEGELGDLRGDHDPKGLDVGKVIQKEAGHGDLPEILLPCGDRDMPELGPGGVEGQGYETLKPFGLVLELPDVEQVFDLFLHRLNMAIEHGGVRLEACTVDLSRYLKPPLVVQFGPKEFLMDPLTEDLGPTPRNTGEAGTLEILQDVTERLFRRSGNLGQLNHGKGLDLSIRTGRPDRLEDVQIILVRELRVDPRHHVDLADDLIVVCVEAGDDFIRTEDVAPGIPGRGVEGAELAQFITDVGVIDVEVPDVVRGIPAHPLPDPIGQETHSGEVWRLVETEAVLVRQALAFQDLPE